MSETLIPPIMATLTQTVTKAIPTLFVLLVMAGGWLTVHRINEGGQAGHEAVVEASDAGSSDTLTLPNGKLEAAQFEAVPAESRPIQHVHTIPGRIRYDDAKHVDVKAPMDGILAEILVTPGEQVKAGQLLAVLRSAEIGQARSEILKRQQQSEIATQLLERETTLAKNLMLLSSMLDEGKSLDSIEASFNNLALGSYRQEILAAYSKMQLSSFRCGPCTS